MRGQVLAEGPCKVQMGTLRDFSFSMTSSVPPFALLHAVQYHFDNFDDSLSRLRLIGSDVNNIEWHCGWIMPDTFPLGNCSVIEGKLTSLMVDEQLAIPTSSTEFVFHASPLHPLARAMETNRL